jgi:hypothetical protein
VWRRFRKNWLNLPAHIRKGLLRLYIAVSALWIVYFGYLIVVVLDGHRYGLATTAEVLNRAIVTIVWHYVSGLFWALLFVPVGGPILFFIAIWIFEGFRKPQIEIGNLRDRIATDILFRPDVAAHEYLATGSLFGKKSPRFRLAVESLSDEQKASLPNEFYGSNDAAPMKWRNYLAIRRGKP